MKELILGVFLISRALYAMESEDENSEIYCSWFSSEEEGSSGLDSSDIVDKLRQANIYRENFYRYHFDDLRDGKFRCYKDGLYVPLRGVFSDIEGIRLEINKWPQIIEQDGDLLYVSLNDGLDILVIDCLENKIIQTLVMGKLWRNPCKNRYSIVKKMDELRELKHSLSIYANHLISMHDSLLYVLRGPEGAIVLMDPKQDYREIEEILFEAYLLDFLAQASILYIAACDPNGIIWLFDLETKKIVKTIVLNNIPLKLRLDGNTLYVLCHTDDVVIINVGD